MRVAPVRVVRRVSRPIGAVMLGLAAAMAVCAAAGVGFRAIGFVRPVIDEGSSLNLLVSAVITAAVGLGLRRAGAQIDVAQLTRRDAIVMTSGIWLVASVFGALPFVLDAGMSVPDAIFETSSGFTTTGATVIGDIEHRLSRPLLLWRSLTQWLGGMGIVVLFVAIFPRVGAGGKHLFRAEVPGPAAAGLSPRIAETALWLWGIYTALTLLQVGVLAALGMPLFEAVCHAMTTLSTGGFSTRDASIGAYGSPAIEVTVALFMLASGVNFGLYYGVVRTRRPSLFLRSAEFRAYLGLVLFTFLVLTVTNLGLRGGDVLQSARYALFTVATFITSTGFGTEDYMAYSPPGLGLILLLMLVGGCAGSTAGGLKVSRIVLVAETLRTQIRHSVRPNVVKVVRMEGVRVPESLLLEVSAFTCLYFAVLFAGTWVIAGWEQVPLTTAFGATLTSVSNMGPAPWWIETDNFARYSDPSKLLFAFEMVLGRLEFMTLFALVLPDVWED